MLTTKYDFITYLNDDMFPELNFINKLLIKLDQYSKQIDDQTFAIFFKDGIQNGRVATCFTISKNYSKLFGGKIYSDEYFHGYFADLEFNRLGHLLKRLFYCDDIFVKHDHFELKDNVNVSNENLFLVNDEKVFKLRKKNKFNFEVYKFRLSQIDQIKFN